MVKALGIVLITTVLSGCGESEPVSHCNDNLTNSLLSYRYAQDFVKQKLVAPSSASFPNSQDSSVQMSYLGNCIHQIKSYVDSDNRLGANIRTQFDAEIRYDDESGQVILHKLDM
jgi:hypothetical protein